MVLPPDLIDVVNVLQQNMFINAPTISQVAALQCWEAETIEELEKHVAKYRASREYILKEMENLKEIPAKNVAPADGGFYVYVDLDDRNVCMKSGLGSTEMCRQLLEEEGVAFTPGVSFFSSHGKTSCSLTTTICSLLPTIDRLRGSER